MRFSLEQRFSAPLRSVEAAFIDPALLAALAALPQLGRPVLLTQTVDGDTVRQDVRYAFVGDLSPAVTRVVDPQRLTWVERSEPTGERTGPSSRSGPTTTPIASAAQGP